MEKTNDFMKTLKATYGLTSDYQLAKKLGISKGTIYNYNTKNRCMDDEVCLKVADLLELEPGYVLACIHAERGGSPETVNAWKHIAAQFAACFVVVFTGFLGGAVPF